MATAQLRNAASRVASRKGEAIADLMLEVAQFFFRLRALGQKTGLIASWGAGAFGFMRSLALIGPLTVPQIAQMRPTSRQRMQRLADELAADGLVEVHRQSRHRRSKLVRLTRKGNARYRELSARLLEIACTMGADLSEADIRKTIETVRRLSDEVEGRRLNQLQRAKARVPVFADDQVIMHRDAERRRNLDDRFSMSAAEGVGSPDG